MFTIEKISSMIFITDSSNGVWASWDESEFTERKLANAMKKIQRGYQYEVFFTRTF